MPYMLNRAFRLTEYRTTVRTEVVGGLTTFLAMAYIIVVNPMILAGAGIDQNAGTVATILAAVFGCILMGLYANRPFAVAPYMGENAFIATTAVAAGFTWQQCLGSVFVSGVAFAVLTLIGLRTWLAGAISTSMKFSFAVGIGLFLTLIGLWQMQLVVAGGPGVPLKIGNLHDVKVLLGIANFVLMAVLMAWRVRAAILLGIVITAVVGIAMGLGQSPSGVVQAPWSEQYDLGKIAFQLDIAGALAWAAMPILLTLFLMSFLDTLGTLVAVGEAGQLLDKHGNLPQVERPMLVDSLACMFSGLIGTSTSGVFIESATGIREGARTGLAAVTTGLLFAATLFFLPLVEPLQQLTFAYGPALLAVGVLMIGNVSRINFEDLTEAVPAIATIAMMVFTFNIANGLTAGLVLYPIFKVVCGKWRDLNWGSAVLGSLCLAYYLFGVVH